MGTATPRLLTEILRASDHQAPSSHLVHGCDRCAKAELDLLSDRLAGALIHAGVCPGDRVLTLIPNSIAFVIASFAVWKARAILVPEDPQTRQISLRHVLADAQPAAAIVESRAAETLSQTLAESSALGEIFVTGPMPTIPGRTHVAVTSLEAVLQRSGPVDSESMLPAANSADDVVSISYTSGSTGERKGVVHTHESWLAGAEFTRDYHAVSSDDSMLLSLPLHHAYAFRQLLTYFLADASVVLAGDIYQALKLLPVHRPTALLLVPAGCNIILDHFGSLFGQAAGCLRYVEVGSAAMPPERLRQLQALLPKMSIHLPYGLTEARVAFLRPGSDGQLNRIAAVSPGLELDVVDAHRQPLRDGESGEIRIRGRGLMQGYWRWSEAKQESLKRHGFCTGDAGVLVDSGEVELLGRLDDVLKIGGRKVNPKEVERALNRHPHVLESAVVGQPDARGILERTLHAFVVPKPGSSLQESELLAFCRECLEPYKVPQNVSIRESLPKSSLGKVLRQSLAVDAASRIPTR